MKGKYKRAKAWCMGCDMVYLAIGKKCFVCGTRTGIKQKKPTSRQIILSENQ